MNTLVIDPISKLVSFVGVSLPFAIPALRREHSALDCREAHLAANRVSAFNPIRRRVARGGIDECCALRCDNCACT